MSDLDNEELIATRRLNGLEDNLFKEDSDIEKNIKRCEKLTEPQNANWIGISNQMAIAGVLARIKELEEENAKLEAIKRYNFESIPVQKVKEKIGEINKKYEDSKDENGESPYYYPEYTIRVLEKLLEENK